MARDDEGPGLFVPWQEFADMVLVGVHPWREREARARLEEWAPEEGQVVHLTVQMLEELRDWEHKESGERSRYIPASVRRAVMERDGQRCRNCGSTDRPSIDHIKPYSRRGRHRKHNLQVLCRSCNSRKHARTMAEWRRC